MLAAVGWHWLFGILGIATLAWIMPWLRITARLPAPAADSTVRAEPSYWQVFANRPALSLSLAQELETRLQAPLLEIYGSTETGQIAMRNSTRTAEWILFRGVRLNHEADVTWAAGGHVEQPVAMNDVIEILGGDRFLLHGRMADMINIAGKRNSLANLNLQLGAIAGVVDGAFFMPDAASADQVTRLSAFVVAPGLTPVQVMAGLRERIDSVFLPRPLVFVDALPRNATGKLPREALQALAAKGKIQ